jgi:hypothetical protein
MAYRHSLLHKPKASASEYLPVCIGVLVLCAVCFVLEVEVGAPGRLVLLLLASGFWLLVLLLCYPHVYVVSVSSTDTSQANAGMGVCFVLFGKERTGGSAAGLNLNLVNSR